MEVNAGRTSSGHRRPRPGALRPAARSVVFATTGLCILALWEILGRTVLPSFMARPLGILRAIPAVLTASPSLGLTMQTTFWRDLGTTLGAIVEGMVVGTAAGALLGLVMGRVREVQWFFSVYIRGLYSLPLIALVPLVTLWLGYSPAARLAVIALSAFLPVAVTTADGAAATPQEHLDVGRVFGAKPYQVWFGIALPSALPYLMAGVQLGLARAITNAVAVEVLASVSGLGLSAFGFAQSFHQNAAFVYVLALALFAIGTRALVIAARRRFAAWDRS
jgi:ABC-type nitrate/sulfonate/bicarbonate transport system permease component